MKTCSNKRNTSIHLIDISKYKKTWPIPQGHSLIFIYLLLLFLLYLAISKLTWSYTVISYEEFRACLCLISSMNLIENVNSSLKHYKNQKNENEMS